MSDRADVEARIIGQAMSDANFRKKLLADPVGTLRGAGVDVPEGVSVQVVQDTATLVHMVLPAPVGDSEISDSDLDMVSAGCGTTHVQTGGQGSTDRSIF
jgi:Nitrile hydratase, alpha chain